MDDIGLPLQRREREVQAEKPWTWTDRPGRLHAQGTLRRRRSQAPMPCKEPLDSYGVNVHILRK